MDTNTINEKTLKDLIFVEFFEALKTDDYESLGISEENFDDLINEYFKHAEASMSITEQTLQKLKVEIAILSSTVQILSEGYNKELIELLQDYKIELYPDNVQEVIEVLVDKVRRLTQKHTVLDGTIIKIDEDKITSPYDILANLSLGLEIGLNFDKVTVMQYLSYSKALKRKNRDIKAQINKHKK